MTVISKEIKWTKYLCMSLLSFASFMVEYFSIFIIEKWLLHVDIWNYTPLQKSQHCLITACLWLIIIGLLLLYSRMHYAFPHRSSPLDKIQTKDWMFAIICLGGCKVMTFIDWHTLKVIGEAAGKDIFQFFAQYIYYFVEVGLVLLIVMFGQKAIEVLFRTESSIPYGGIILAVSWGAFHFVSRGVGLEIWNGISCMIFSVLSGFMYLRLKRKYLLSYLFLAIGYLL